MSAAPETPILHLLRTDAPGAALVKTVQRRGSRLPCFLAESGSIPAGPRPFHSGSVLAHTARCMDAVAGDPPAVWMAMVHDAGKLTTPAVLLPHHYGHELRGAALAAVWARQMNLPDDYARAGVMTALLHMKAGRYARLRPGKRYDLLTKVAASGFFEPFWKVVDADTKSAVSAAANRDWKRICGLFRKGIPPEKARQMGIALLQAVRSA